MNNRRAQIFIITLIVMFITLSLGLTLLFYSRSLRNITRIQVDTDRAYSLAKSGINFALYNLNREPENWASTGALNLGGGSFQIQILNRQVIAKRVIGSISSTGKVGRSSRTLTQGFNFLKPPYLWVAHTTSIVNKINKNTASITWTSSPIPVADSSYAIAVDNTYVWVLGASRVTRIRRSDLLIANSPVILGVSLNRMVLDNDFVWVTDDSSDVVARIDKNNLTVTTISNVGNWNNDIELDINSNCIWVVNSFSDGEIWRIDRTSAAATKIIDFTSGNSIAVAVDNNNTDLWVAHTTNIVNKINKNTASITWTSSPIPVADSSYAIAVDNTYVWVLGASRVTRIRRSDLLIANSPVILGVSLNRMVLDNDFVWVTDASSDVVARIDKNNLTLTTISNVGNWNNDIELDINSNCIWVVDDFYEDLWRIDRTSAVATKIIDFTSGNSIAVAVEDY